MGHRRQRVSLVVVRDSIIIGVSAGSVFLLAVAFIGSLIYRSVCDAVNTL